MSALHDRIGSIAAHLPLAGRRAIGLAAAACLVAGCSSQSAYRIEMSTPWADEPPPRESRGTRDLRLESATLRWHAALDRRALSQQVRALAADSPDLYVLVRDGLARRDSGRGPRLLRFVEARIGPRILSAAALGLSGGGAGAAARGQVDMLAGLIRSGRMLAAARYMPFTVRSYEYDSQADFLAAVRATVAALSRLPTAGTTDVESLSAWRDRNAGVQQRVMQELYAPDPSAAADSPVDGGARRIRRPASRLAPPTPEVLPVSEPELRRHLLLALPVVTGATLPGDAGARTGNRS